MNLIVVSIIGILANLLVAIIPLTISCLMNVWYYKSWDYMNPLWLPPYIGVPLILWSIFTMHMYFSNIKKINREVLKRIGNTD